MGERSLQNCWQSLALRQVHAQLIEKSVGLCFQIRVHADTDVCGISSHIINPFLLVLLVYAICTKKTILCTNI